MKDHTNLKQKKARITAPKSEEENKLKMKNIVRDRKGQYIKIKNSLFLEDCDCSHEIKTCLLLGRKLMTNLDSILKSRDITLSTKVCLVKAMVFPVVMYGCES